MVNARIARKVDFGEGRSRFEPTYRHPRHFHLICTTCRQSSEFLSSDVEALIEEISGARGFTISHQVVQVYGTCEVCKTSSATGATGVPRSMSKSEPISGTTTERLFARDALRMAIATERNGLSFYTRAAAITADAGGRAIFERLAGEEREHLATLEARYRDLIGSDAELEARPTFLFFKGAASGLFAAGAEELRAGVDDERALLIGIECERGSHRFFKRYGERFEDSEGKQIFLEFAREEQAHLDLLIREYRALKLRRARPRRTTRSARRAG